MTRVILNGHEFDMDAVVALMDDEIREQLNTGWREGEQAFLDAYVVAHAEKFDGEAFVVN